jgi:chromosome segregation ATPase
MESSATALEFRLRDHDRRLEANHDSLKEIRVSNASHETKISVITTELRETREDLSEIRRELTWVKRGLWAAAATFLMFFVAAASLLLSLSGGG